MWLRALHCCLELVVSQDMSAEFSFSPNIFFLRRQLGSAGFSRKPETLRSEVPPSLEPALLWRWQTLSFNTLKIATVAIGGIGLSALHRLLLPGEPMNAGSRPPRRNPSRYLSIAEPWTEVSLRMASDATLFGYVYRPEEYKRR
jgi:hypothetical protein